MMRIRHWLERLFRTNADFGEPAAVPAPTSAAVGDSTNEPASVSNLRVLLIIANPRVNESTGARLSHDMGWRRPDELARRFIAEILQASAGLVRYQIADRIELDEFPVLADGFQYNPVSYRAVVSGAVQAHEPAGIDYVALLERFHVLKRMESRQLDEVWVMAFPHAGLYESVMAGRRAFWCNAPPLLQTSKCDRRFVVMGFSFERDIGEMLHSYNHRAEAILARVFNSLGFLAWAYKTNRVPATIRPDQQLNLFERFILFDAIAPGMAGMGTVHYAPNAARDYDLGSPRLVASTCYDWLRFPEFQGDVRLISASEWGGASEHAYQRWWMNHLPRTSGRTNGVHNNWWQYIANLDNVVD